MKENKGFTLVELLISFTLLTIVLIYLIKATTNIMVRENEVLMLQEYNVFESTLLNNIYDDTEGLTDLKIEENNGELNIRVGNSVSIYKNISFVNNKDEKGIYYDNVLYELPENVEFNSSKYYTIKNGTYTEDNYTKNYSIVSIYLIMNNKDKKINIIFQNADKSKLVKGTILEKAQNLVYNGNVCKNDGTTYNYMGGCYIKGQNSNNYVWYNGFMWRIMGINSDNSVRLITDENVTTIPYGAANTALTYKTNEGYINDWLNNYFYENLNNTKSVIQKGNYFCSETTNETTLTEGRTSCTTNNIVNAKIGIISLDEYLLAGGTDSYLNLTMYSWTMTPYNTKNVWNTTFNNNILNNSVTSAVGVRPVINVTSTSKVTKGIGVSNDYYALVENKTDNKTGKMEDNATSGEYVKLNDKVYRIVSKDNDGIKLILDGYYESTLPFGTSSTYSASEGIGQSLNNDVLTWLGLNNSSTIVESSWYQGTDLNDGFKYTDSMSQSNKVTSKVGLLRLGEMLSGHSSTILTKNYTENISNNDKNVYWLFNKTGNNSTSWIVSGNGAAYKYDVATKFSIRPVIKIKNGLQISKGTGTYDNPLELQKLCKRATKLHTEECTQTDTTYLCSGAGYTASGSKKTSTITYGNLGTKGTLSSGDAFDCDVNGDETYDSNTERFYYVTDMDDNTAVLIYYNNVSAGSPSNSAIYAYDSSEENFHGPRTAIEQLPTTSQWKNVSLKNSTRAILNENAGNTTTGGTLPSNFSYSGYAARLLTISEVRKGTGISNIPTWKVGELDNFTYLLENTKFASKGNAVWGWWLENARSDNSTNAWNVNGYYRHVNNSTVSNADDYGIRPAIEVLKSDISY